VDERCEKVFRLSLFSRRGRIVLDDGFCDFAFGSAQNDRMGSIMLRMKVSGLEKPNLRVSSTLRLFIDTLSTGFV
jgi:hypothetical protein